MNWFYFEKFSFFNLRKYRVQGVELIVATELSNHTVYRGAERDKTMKNIAFSFQMN